MARGKLDIRSLGNTAWIFSCFARFTHWEKTLWKYRQGFMFPGLLQYPANLCRRYVCLDFISGGFLFALRRDFKGILFRFDLSYSSISSLPLPFTGDNTSVAHFIVVVFYMALLFADSAIREFGVFQGLRKYDWIYYSFILASVFCFGYFGKSTFIYAQF